MKHLVFLSVLLISNLALAQNTVTGTVLDDNAEPLPSANVALQGTSKGTTTDFDGEFEIETDQNSGDLKISFVGSKSQVVHFEVEHGQSVDVGEITLKEGGSSLGEVVLVGKGVVDLEEDRETPIAVSSVKRDQIQLRSTGNVEFPNTLKNTPSVYVSNESGGFGDSEMFVRGFDQTNTAFLFNGQPINGMEDGKMYWSNWSGISDIANAVQVQRGLGSSKLAISSVGGTINMVTKTTEKNRGGFARFLTGNDGYLKGTLSYDTGISDDGWGFSFLLDYWHADNKYAHGTRGEGQNYFFSVGKQIGDNHNINFLITGAPQQHDQNFSKEMKLYDRYGKRYNNNYGYKHGDYLSERRNYYHKPIINLNWDWDIDEEQQLSTVLYASFGRGGGTGTIGNGMDHMDDYPNGDPELQDGAYRAKDGLIDWDYVVEQNNKIGDGISEGFDGTLLRSSVNNHQWYGGVTNYEYNKIENLTINVGADLRFYKGVHFQQLIDKLGLEGRKEPMYGNPDHTAMKTYKADPWQSLFSHASRSDRVNYDYTEHVNYQGGFGQAEYANDDFSVFVQGAFSNQSYERKDRGIAEESSVSRTLHKTGYDLKGGASYNLSDQHEIFVNAGKYSRQPFLTNIFTSYDDNSEITEDVDNEEITGFEAGYKFELDDKLKVNVNAYYTDWKNRFINASGSYEDPDTGEEYSNVGYLFTNIEQKHKGVEVDAEWNPTMDLMINGHATFGHWRYDGTTPVLVRDNDEQEMIVGSDDPLTTDLKDTKVGQSPQTTFGMDVTYTIIPGELTVYGNWNYYTDFYGFVDVEDAAKQTLENEDEVYQPDKLNSYSLFDIGGHYNFKISDQRFRLTANVYNLFDHTYISQKDNYGYYFGNGTTYNIAVKYLF